jgi:hypothetical protein
MSKTVLEGIGLALQTVKPPTLLRIPSLFPGVLPCFLYKADVPETKTGEEQ